MKRALAIMAFVLGTVLSVFSQRSANIVFIGNSITYGALHEHRELTAPPVQCAQWLSAQEGIDTVFFSNCGRSGRTTYHFLPRSEDVVPAGDKTYFPDVVAKTRDIVKSHPGLPLLFSIMLGTNDTVERPKNEHTSPADYARNLCVIIDSLLALWPDAHVVLNKPIWYTPDYVTRNGSVASKKSLKLLASYYDTFPQVVAHCKAGHVHIGDADAYDYFERNWKTDIIEEKDSRDRSFWLHPNEQGAAHLAQFWGKALLNVLEKIATASGRELSGKRNGEWGQRVTFVEHQLRIEGEPMSWTLHTDGSQYPWVGEQYEWGKTYYDADGEITVTIDRRQDGDDIVETYTFTNQSNKEVTLRNIGIYTPFNDNYPGANTCMTSRCNVHINANGRGAWVNLLRMNGTAPNIGLMVTEGSITDYDVWERGQKKGMSNFRGVFALCPPDTTLSAGRSFRLQWRLFCHQGGSDFNTQLLKRGGTVVSSPKFIYAVGEKATVTFTTAKGSKTKTKTKTITITKTGDHRVEYEGSSALLLGISGERELMEKRINFILDHQQYNNPDDPRHGAFMVYDCEGDSILINDHGRSDLDEGRERVGMGILLAAYGLLSEKGIVNSEKLHAALDRYATFVRTKLQESNYRTKSNVRNGGKNRGYNYAWVADFYFRMALLTGNKQYALDGYATMQSLYRQFGYGFYCIDYPVLTGLKALKQTGLRFEHDMLLYDFQQTGDIFVKNGLNFPSFEVNYEQSIVAPAVQFLCELYQATGNSRYLRGAETMLPALEAFNGQQPNYHQHEIAIRHWDGYWFGKRQTYGDCYPHYWSAITAAAYHRYAQATGKQEYQQRAQQIVRGNLSLFFEDGKATCAYVFPRRVNGETAHYADAYANDQDWALLFYLLVNYES